MAMGFAECVRLVRLHCPAAPLFLCREWVNVAYKQLLARRRWGFMRTEIALTTADARPLTVSVVHGSATISSVAAFLPEDAGRQFRIDGSAAYTIVSVTDPSTATLDRPFAELSEIAADGLIYDGYVTLPSDFASFRLIVDPSNQTQIPFRYSQAELAATDPARTSSDGTARALIAISPSTYPPTLGQARYEWWPRPTAARTYRALYTKQGARLGDADLFTGVLADGGEVLVAGALALAAEWPGTPDKPNPYFRMEIADRKKAEFDYGVQMLSLRDDEQYPDDFWVQASGWAECGLGGSDTVLRANDATVAAFW